MSDTDFERIAVRDYLKSVIRRLRGMIAYERSRKDIIGEGLMETQLNTLLGIICQAMEITERL